MNIKLLGDRVIVKPLGYEQQEINGLKFTPNEIEMARKGEVLKVGPGIDGYPMIIEEGDIVLYGRDAGIEITIENRKVLIMRESDIYTAIEDEKTN